MLCLDGERATLRLPTLGADEVQRLTPEAPTLLLTLHASVLDLRSGATSWLVDRSGWVVLPPGDQVELEARSPVLARVLLLTLHRPLLESVVDAYRGLGLERGRLERQLHTLQLLPRTVWVHEICHRYLFERHALNEHDNPATRFLEMEVLKELYYLCRDRDAGADRSTLVARHSPGVEKALAYVEGHLLQPLAVPALARHCGTSESTLLRAFKRELGCTPGTYHRTRRLDEALALLGTGRWSVSEVAAQVGYENPTAFSHAFQLRFGRTPSSCMPHKKVRGPGTNHG